MSCTVLYNKYDVTLVASCVSTERAQLMLKSDIRQCICLSLTVANAEVYPCESTSRKWSTVSVESFQK